MTRALAWDVEVGERSLTARRTGLNRNRRHSPRGRWPSNPTPEYARRSLMHCAVNTMLEYCRYHRSQLLLYEMGEFRAARLAEIAQQVERAVPNQSREVNVRERYVWLRIGLDKMRSRSPTGRTTAHLASATIVRDEEMLLIQSAPGCLRNRAAPSRPHSLSLRSKPERACKCSSSRYWHRHCRGQRHRRRHRRDSVPSGRIASRHGRSHSVRSGCSSQTGWC